MTGHDTLLTPRAQVPALDEDVAHPYRDPPATRAQPASPADEERIIYAFLAVIGVIPVAIALVGGGSFGVEATIGALMVLAGLVGFAASTRVRTLRLKPGRARSDHEAAAAARAR